MYTVIIIEQRKHIAFSFVLQTFEIFLPISFGCHQPWNRSYGNQLYDLYDEVKLLSKYYLT